MAHPLCVVGGAIQGDRVTAGSLVKTQRSGSVATVTLSRPERHNSLIPELLSELLDAFTELEADSAVRAVVLGAEGKSFSTGGDVKAFFVAGEDLAVFASKTVGLLHRVMMTMMRLPQPIVTAVHGMVTGGSLGLLLASDIVLVSPDVTITPWYSVVGFSPDGGWTAILPDVIGRERTSHLLLHNRSISAEQAVAWGVASEIVSRDSIGERAAAAATDIAAMKPGSVASIKRLLHADDSTIEARLERERDAFVEQIVKPEALKGMAAFLGRPR